MQFLPILPKALFFSAAFSLQLCIVSFVFLDPRPDLRWCKKCETYSYLRKGGAPTGAAQLVSMFILTAAIFAAIVFELRPSAMSSRRSGPMG